MAGTLASVPLLAMAVACSSTEPVDQASSQKLQVVTTILTTTLFTKAVAGDCAQVSSLLPAGADSHAHQARPQDVASLGKAQVLVINGLGMESFLEPVLKGAENKELITIDSSSGINPLAMEEKDDHGHGHHHHHDHGHAHGDAVEAVNPHVWLDPTLAAKQVETIRDGLMKADPSCADGYRNRADAYITKLQQLDSELAAELAPFQGRTVVSFHEALPYFTRRYGLSDEALVTLPEDQPSPADVQRINQVLKANNIAGVLTEPGGGSAALQSLAKDLTLRLEVFDPLELVPEASKRTPELYIEVMRRNGEAVKATMKS
ncbi:metal ABC transporter solute-binding protein, Zn/Mn family [Synechococcus sp. Minos11]|uniref:metal ABC transporter solute-binding protein, Zn/Mn family n=1 Tax=Synechococcus sp. Minos11 TaxID=221341 RepID=UPI002104E65E|nr:zinc ABC transporter substrate-binding protein [Synechococcus sp. Minos11]